MLFSWYLAILNFMWLARILSSALLFPFVYQGVEGIVVSPTDGFLHPSMYKLQVQTLRKKRWNSNNQHNMTCYIYSLFRPGLALLFCLYLSITVSLACQTVLVMSRTHQWGRDMVRACLTLSKLEVQYSNGNVVFLISRNLELYMTCKDTFQCSTASICLPECRGHSS